MKFVTISVLVLAATCGACAAIQGTRAAADVLATGGEDDLPVDFNAESPLPAASHTTFKPRIPSSLPVPALDARFEVRARSGAVLESIRMLRDGAHIFAGHADGSSGWYFLQNQVTPAQFTGWRIDPAEHLLLEHSHSDLIVEGIAHSWDEVATFGVDADLLSALRATGEQERAFDVEFERYVCDGAPLQTIRELWWNEALRLPLRIVRGSGDDAHTQVLIGFERSMDTFLLQLPAKRFPSYTLIDLADWREEHHEHVADAAHDAPGKKEH